MWICWICYAQGLFLWCVDRKGKEVRTPTTSKSRQPATQHDLELWGGELTRRIDGVEAKMDRLKDEILDHFDAAVENIEADLKGANRDEISLLKTKQQQHEQRISVLERRSGLPST